MTKEVVMKVPGSTEFLLWFKGFAGGFAVWYERWIEEFKMTAKV